MRLTAYFFFLTSYLLLVTISQTANAQVVNIKTNQATFLSTNSWSIETQTLVTGAVKPTPFAVIGNKGYFCANQAIVELNLDQPLNSSSQSYLARAYSQLPSVAGVIRHPGFQNGSRLILVTQNPTRIAYINRENLAFIPSTTPDYPPTIDALEEYDVLDIETHQTDPAYQSFFIISEVGVANVEAGSLQSTVYRVPSGRRVSSGAWDYQRDYLFLALADGAIFRLKINHTDIGSSEVTSIQLPEVYGGVPVAEIDVKRGYLYCASAGLNATQSSNIYRINVNTFQIDHKLLNNNEFEYRVTVGAIDANAGLLYLATDRKSVV